MENEKVFKGSQKFQFKDFQKIFKDNYGTDLTKMIENDEERR